jgi:hypothetical protein
MPIRSRIVAFLGGGREALERKGNRVEERGRGGLGEWGDSRPAVQSDNLGAERAGVTGHC